jgi:predicted ATPase
VLGEPGIGKTTLCEQLAGFATSRGGRALFGHCYEEGSLALPYLPFVQALRGYILERDAAALRDKLGAGATELARIVPEVTERIGVQPAVHDTLDAEERRYRLLQAVTDFLVRAAVAKPLLVVLEDLHDADHGTLDLLVHLSRQMAGSRLLVVGTYRVVEVDRAHPLAATLAKLRRSTQFGRVQLKGLTTAEVQQLLIGLGVPHAGLSVAEAVHKRTEGNPLLWAKWRAICKQSDQSHAAPDDRHIRHTGRAAEDNARPPGQRLSGRPPRRPTGKREPVFRTHDELSFSDGHHPQSPSRVRCLPIHAASNLRDRTLL